ncbi:GNAT family N-acetyltransferase [Streptomyces tsukubensis]|nr:N-acetyltransferase [Streptomyces tsukubensis]EIF89829.1 GCN5-like N-acetyltransferase [Streptomyces tsukubensis NRRL18488]
MRLMPHTTDIADTAATTSITGSADTTGFSLKPTLHGERVTLRPFTEADVPVMAAILDDPEVLRFTGSTDEEESDAADPQATAALHTWYTSRNDQHDRLDLAVVDRTSGRVVGEVVLHEWDPANRNCRFRTLIGPEGRGRGLGTEATRMIVDHGFEHIGLHRIALSVFAFNPRARRVYEKVGFVAEGVEREVLRHGDTWVDATAMSVLAHEWRALHRP